MWDRAGLNIASSVGTHAKYRGSRIAFKCGDRQVTWGEFDARVNQVANALIKAGLKKGGQSRLVVPQLHRGPGNHVRARSGPAG